MWLWESIYVCLSLHRWDKPDEVSARGERDADAGNRVWERRMSGKERKTAAIASASEWESKKARERESGKTEKERGLDVAEGRKEGTRRRSGLTGRQLLSPAWNIVFHARHGAYARITTRRLMSALPTASINSGVDARRFLGGATDTVEIKRYLDYDFRNYNLH